MPLLSRINPGELDFISAVYQTFKNSILQKVYHWILTYSNKRISWLLIHEENRYFVAFCYRFHMPERHKLMKTNCLTDEAMCVD